MALSLTLGFIATETVTGPDYAIADTGGYPDWNKPCVAAGNYYGQTTGPGYWCTDYQWGILSSGQQNSSRTYGYRNCTDWAAFRIPQLTGISAPPRLGGAKNWDNNAPSNWIIDNTPEPGDIAVWEDGNYGHVAVVESINPLVVSEYNHHQDGNYGTRTNPAGIDHFLDLNGTGVGINGGGGGGEAPPPPPQLQSSSTVSHNSALHIFARGQDHELYDKAYNASSWNSLQRIQPGSLFEAGPTAVQYAGELHLLGRGTNNEFYKNTLTSVGWTGFQRLERGGVFEGE